MFQDGCAVSAGVVELAKKKKKKNPQLSKLFPKDILRM